MIRKLMIKSIFILASCMMLFGCFPIKSGIEPLYPSDGETVNTLKPTFTWHPFTDIKDGKQDIRYQIIIKDNTYTVETKADINTTSFTAEHQLMPNKEYNWCIIPTWTRDNHKEFGQCNYHRYFYFAGIVFGTTAGKFYTFKTPDNAIEKPKEVSSAPLALSKSPSSNEPLRKYAWDGQFYSEHYTEAQILNMESSKAVSVRHLILTSNGCGAYSAEAADKKFVIEPIKQRMQEINALAVRNIRVSEKSVPSRDGCFNWNVEGEFYQAVSSEKPAQRDDSARLQKLKDMRASGVITEQEYQKKRKEIIDTM